MKTRNSSATPKKKNPTAKKTAAKPLSTPSSVETAPVQSPTTKMTEIPPPRPVPNTRGKQAKPAEIFGTPAPGITPPPAPAPASTPATPTAPTPPTPAVPADPKAVDESVATQMTSEIKPVKTRRVVKRVIRKTVVRSAKNPKSVVTTKVEESTKETDVAEVADQKPLVKDAETAKIDNEINVAEIEKIPVNEEPKIENVEEDKEANLNAQETANEEEAEAKAEEYLMENVTKSPKEQELEANKSKSLEDQELAIGKEKEELMEQQEEQRKTTEDKMETMSYEGKMEDYPKEERTDFDGLLEEADDEKIEGIADQDIHDELDQDQDQDQFPEDDVPEQGESASEDEHVELDAAAKERKLRKELEIFVGGLDGDFTEEDLKKIFQNAGVVVNVRLHKDPSTNKNNGYAFVRFANKEQVNRALSEMKNPVIRGKRCGIAPSGDNDSLFVGNICNTWTTEAIKQKLKDYGIEGVEKITLVADPKHEGLSRGFAFLEFSCHGEAMLAYKRLQKSDAIFGHPERSVKVAFAEPLREPDPEVMAQVKSVFVDGLPPHWDEHRVKEKFRHFGEIANVVLARNMSTAKRKDFGFVDFTTHESAVACIESVNSLELVDGNSKVKVRARLSNPLPKTQAVKGGMAGGFRIAQGGGGTHPRFGKGFGRGGRGHSFNHSDFKQNRGFYPHGPGQGSRMGFANAHELDSAYGFLGRHNSDQGGRWGFRGAHQGSTGGPLPNRHNFDRVQHGGPGDYDPLRREPFPPEVNQPYLGGHIDDRYFYDDSARGMKRPYSMRDQDIGYMEPSTRRTRFEYSDAVASFHGNRYRADAGHYQQDYYGSNHDGRAYPPFYGGDRPYGRGYYY